MLRNRVVNSEEVKYLFVRDCYATIDHAVTVLRAAYIDWKQDSLVIKYFIKTTCPSVLGSVQKVVANWSLETHNLTTAFSPQFMVTISAFQKPIH